LRQRNGHGRSPAGVGPDFDDFPHVPETGEQCAQAVTPPAGWVRDRAVRGTARRKATAIVGGDKSQAVRFGAEGSDDRRGVGCEANPCSGLNPFGVPHRFGAEHRLVREDKTRLQSVFRTGSVSLHFGIGGI